VAGILPAKSIGSIVGPTKQRQNDHSTSPTIIVKPQSELINTQSCNYSIEACEQNVLIRFLIKDLIVLRTSVKVHGFLIIKRENLFAGSYKYHVDYNIKDIKNLRFKNMNLVVRG